MYVIEELCVYIINIYIYIYKIKKNASHDIAFKYVIEQSNTTTAHIKCIKVNPRDNIQCDDTGI